MRTLWATIQAVSSIISKLQKLADELTVHAPPPPQPKGLNYIVPNSGKWVVVKVGSGMYAVRPEYETTNGEKIIATRNGETRGFPNSIEASLRFAISVTTASRFYWAASTIV